METGKEAMAAFLEREVPAYILAKEPGEVTAYLLIRGSISPFYGPKESLPSHITVLTDEQAAFYKEHPAASVRDVLNCEIYAPPAPDLDKYKEHARQMLTDKVSAYLHGKVDHDKLNEAIVIKTTGVETDTVSMQVAEDRINYYGRLNAALKAYKLETYRAINECTDVSGVDRVMNNIQLENVLKKIE